MQGRLRRHLLPNQHQPDSSSSSSQDFPSTPPAPNQLSPNPRRLQRQLATTNVVGSSSNQRLVSHPSWFSQSAQSFEVPNASVANRRNKHLVALRWRLFKHPLSLGSETSKSSGKDFFDVAKVEKGPKEVFGHEVQKEALTLEEQEGSVNFKFGVLYCNEGQTSDEEMYNNEYGSEEFDNFIQILGDKIELKSWDRFKGGLDNKSGATGIQSFYTVYEGHEIMFHISTLLPFSGDNRQQIERKRHVGNDIVNIIFVNGCEEGVQPSWTPSMMKTHFTHIFAVITYSKSTAAYRLNIFAEESVPFFGPALPNPPEFTNPQEFREFLLVKLINGEKAAFHSPVFARKRERTLEMLLSALCANYFSDSSLWQPKSLECWLPSQPISGDTYGDKLIVSTSEEGTFIVRDQENPKLVIDKSVEVKQLEVVEQIDLIILRFDKGKEARISILNVGELLSSQQPIERGQLKKMSLEKAKGGHLFALSKANTQLIRLAVACSKRILIFQWQIIAGHSLSSWNQFAQLNPIESFQFIREINTIEPAHAICFLESTSACRLCVGHRGQVDVFDEQNKVTPVVRNEGSRSGAASVQEIVADNELGLLISFARSCLIVKTNSLGLPLVVGRKAPLTASQSLLPTSSTATRDSSTSPHPLVCLTCGSGTSTSFDQPSSTTGHCYAASPQHPSTSLSSNHWSDSNRPTGRTEVVWNFEPKFIVANSPYLFAFTPMAIEIRLSKNGSLVHTLSVADCHYIGAKEDLFFSSTSRNLDYQSANASSLSSQTASAFKDQSSRGSSFLDPNVALAHYSQVDDSGDSDIQRTDQDEDDDGQIDSTSPSDRRSTLVPSQMRQELGRINLQSGSQHMSTNPSPVNYPRDNCRNHHIYRISFDPRES